MNRKRLPITREEETRRHLATSRKTRAVVAQPDASKEHGTGETSQPEREITDESLRVEREQSDIALAKTRRKVEHAADAVVRIARRRADGVVQEARDKADGARPRDSTKGEETLSRRRSAADGLIRAERSAEDRVLKEERTEGKRSPDAFLAVERDETDRGLADERALADTLTFDQREAAEYMVRATISAQEMASEAEEARDRLHDSERELLAVAEVRELFIGVLGHDLRNPLSSIGISAALLLRRGHLDPQDALTVSRIIRSSQQMGRRITQLFELTRARLGGGFPLERKSSSDLGFCSPSSRLCACLSDSGFPINTTGHSNYLPTRSSPMSPDGSFSPKPVRPMS